MEFFLSYTGESIKFCLISVLLFFSLTLPCTAQTKNRGMTADVRTLDAEGIAALGQNGWGVNLVRLQLVNANATTDSAEQYTTWLEGALDGTEALLPIFAANGIKVVLDLHSPPGGFASEKPPQDKIFSESWAQQLLIQSWTTIAARFNTSEVIWGYDLVSEPAQGVVAPGLLSWKELQAPIAQAIRAVGPGTADNQPTLVIEPIFGDIGRISTVDPSADSNMVLSPHFWFPRSFTSQGTPAGGKAKMKVYPDKKTKKKKKKKRLNKATLKRRMAKAKKFAKKNGLGVYIGEFGVVRWAPKNSGVRYLRDVVKLFEKSGWDWTYHAFREADAWSLEHSDRKNDSNPATTPTKRLLLMQSFFALN